MSYATSFITLSLSIILPPVIYGGLFLFRGGIGGTRSPTGRSASGLPDVSGFFHLFGA